MSKRRQSKRHGGRARGTVGVVAAGLAAILLGAWALSAGTPVDRGGQAGATSATTHAAAAVGGAIVGVSGVRIDASSVDFGHVPLDVTVSHAFRVFNGGTEQVSLGRAGIAVLEGC